MIIKAIKIEAATAIKISEKHNIGQSEVYDMLKDDSPQFRRAGGNQYVAIGKSKSRFITAFFTYDEQTKEAEITTAYPSDRKQITMYRKVKK